MNCGQFPLTCHWQVVLILNFSMREHFGGFQTICQTKMENDSTQTVKIQPHWRVFISGVYCGVCVCWLTENGGLTARIVCPHLHWASHGRCIWLWWAASGWCLGWFLSPSLGCVHCKRTEQHEYCFWGLVPPIPVPVISRTWRCSTQALSWWWWDPPHTQSAGLSADGLCLCSPTQTRFRSRAGRRVFCRWATDRPSYSDDRMWHFVHCVQDADSRGCRLAILLH